MKRRDFINQTALASGAIFIPVTGIAENLFSMNDSVNKNLEIHIFSKHLQFLNYKDMSEASMEMGFDGVDLTVRPKGHVIPERVIDDLPRATEAMKSFKLIPKMISSNVIDANNELHRTVLKTAYNLGYEYYRPAWIKYKSEDEITERVSKANKQFSVLANLNELIGIKGSYHNHSGHYVGAAIWDLHKALENVTTSHLGCQYDIMHATVEGGENWEIGFKLIKPFINTLVIKDFKWGKVDGRWKRIFTPLGEGMVDFKRYFELLKKNNIIVPMSIHVEYDLGGAENGGNPTIEHKEVFKRIKHDLDFVRRNWEMV
jgi:sugar phosphate isomerase/epimerase